MDAKPFVEWAREAREKKGLSQRQACIVTGRSIKDIERGKMRPSFELCRLLGEAYDVAREEWVAAWLQLSLPVGTDVGPAAAELAVALRDSSDG